MRTCVVGVADGLTVLGTAEGLTDGSNEGRGDG